MLNKYKISNTLTLIELDGGVRYKHTNGNYIEIVGEYKTGEAWLRRGKYKTHYEYTRNDDTGLTLFYYTRSDDLYEYTLHEGADRRATFSLRNDEESAEEDVEVLLNV